MHTSSYLMVPHTSACFNKLYRHFSYNIDISIWDCCLGLMVKSLQSHAVSNDSSPLPAPCNRTGRIGRTGWKSGAALPPKVMNSQSLPRLLVRPRSRGAACKFGSQASSHEKIVPQYISMAGVEWTSSWTWYEILSIHRLFDRKISIMAELIEPPESTNRVAASFLNTKRP